MQKLFVAHKTVEMHLSRAYRKLGISSRSELQKALATSNRDAVRACLLNAWSKCGLSGAQKSRVFTPSPRHPPDA